ncbi:patatin-like phospholipase family protein [Beijerinckia mobilis]|uniref:patatin-like phospholipase family protein n=1 Tax=Beijerinckia mobilis TaxID=231434 RepID=UPI00054E6965|nr:patatin-like phospholipase family protein [Beijerinckia mobilis]
MRLRFLAAACVTISFLLTSCASLPRVPYTKAEASDALPMGIQKVRLWADLEPEDGQSVDASFKPALARNEHFSYLALSGGGSDGAYGAGILNGWTESGLRPKFNVVSGVSTGALIAPFAFLGPAYDQTLRAIYTDGIASTLVDSPNFTRIIFKDGLFSNQRLQELVSRYVDAPMVEAIALEHRKGRRLFIVTTNLDSQRGVVWNIGAIANSGSPYTIDLIRKVLTASASIPLVFSPVLIDAQAQGHTFQEMHVDGNVTTSFFVLPPSMLVSQTPRPTDGGDVYVLMNTTIDPSFAVVENSTLPITRTSLSTLLRSTSMNKLLATYLYTRTHHIGFHLTSIEAQYAGNSDTRPFDTDHMRRLFELGYQRGRQGHFWQTSPASPKPSILAAQ